VQDVCVGEDEAVFQVDDVGINSRMLGASLELELQLRHVRFLLDARIEGCDAGVLRLDQHGSTVEVRHKFLINATGYGLNQASRELGLPETPVRFWRSHLVILPRLAPRSVFSIAADHAAMINHGEWSIVGLNEDAQIVPGPTFEVDPQLAKHHADRVQERFPRADFSTAQHTACVKVDYARSVDAVRSLNVRVLDLADRALAVLPGKMTEAPFSANAVAAQVFAALGNEGVSLRPVDLIAEPTEVLADA
jgi:glycine/D-amino acid oxidase-like deaminating enzyme